MKKAMIAGVMLLAAVFTLNAASKTELPKFPDAENAGVVAVDKLQLWKMDGITCRKYLDVMNKTTEEGIPLKIYALKKDGGKWEEIGDITLGAPCSATEFDSEKFGRNYRKYKYFAAVPQNGKSYRITAGDDYLDYFAFQKSWLVLNVIPENPEEDMSYKDNAVIIRRAEFDKNDKFDDNITVVNRTSDDGFSVSIYGIIDEDFDSSKLKPTKKLRERLFGVDGENPANESQRILVYGYSEKSEAWNPLCGGTFNGTDKIEAVYHPNFGGWKKICGGAPLYKTFGIVFSNGKKYSVTPTLDGGNLILELTAPSEEAEESTANVVPAETESEDESAE